MQTVVRLVGFWLVTTLVAISNPALAAEKAPAPVVYKLPNGLTVVLKEEHTAPVVAYQMWVRVGSADEPATSAGIAHVFEHMLFKGTKKRAVGQIGREISAAGGDINAYTSNDQTVYHLVLASRYKDTGLDILADATQNSSFDPVELKKELEVVVEEIRRGEDNPDRALGEMLDAEQYKVHPYGRPVIGTVESVRGLSRDEILTFFHKWYVPNNMTLVVVGDFNTADQKKKIAAEFKNFKPNLTLKHSRPQEPPQMAMRITEDTLPFQREKIGIAFPIPSIYNEDSYVMDVIAELLAGSSNSPLYNQLVNKLRIATGVYAYSNTPVDEGSLFATATIDSANRDEVLRQMSQSLFEIGRGEFQARRLTLAKSKIAGEFIFRLESAQGMASQLGFFQAIVGDIHFQDRYLKVIQGLTADRVAAVARKYIRPETMNLAIVAPEGTQLPEEKHLRGIVEEAWRRTESKPAALKIVTKDVVQGTTRVLFDNGTRLLVTPDKGLPIVSFVGGFQGGLRDEPADQAGIANFMASMSHSGTENLTREQLTDRLESINGGFGIGVASDYTTFSGSYLKTPVSEEIALPLFADLLLHPAFPPDEVDNVRKQILPQFALREDNLFQVGLLQFLPKMFGENGYGRVALGDKAVVEKITHDALRDYAHKTMRSDTMTFTVVGDVDPDEFIGDYARLFAEHRSEGKYVPTKLSFPEHGAPVTAVIEKGKAQSHILYGWQAVPVRSEDRYPFEVLNAIMAGMGGRLFLELRDHQSLAYAVTSILPMRREDGAYIVYIGCAPDKVNQSLKGIRDQIGLLREKGVLAKEVAEAKRFLVGNLAVDLQTRSARASSMTSSDLNGLGFRFDLDEYPKKIDAVSVEDVNRVARQYLDPNKYVMVLVK